MGSSGFGEERMQSNMGDRNLGAEILDGINEIKQFKKGKLALRTQELSEPSPPKVIRLKLNMSQSAFASLMGVSVRTLQDWEQGRREPQALQLRFCASLSNTRKFLVNFTDQNDMDFNRCVDKSNPESVVIPKLGDKQGVIRDLVNHSVFFIDSPRPITGQAVFEGLWFSDAFKRLSRRFLDQFVDSAEGLFVGFLPVQIVFPGVLGEDQFHSRSSFS